MADYRPRPRGQLTVAIYVQPRATRDEVVGRHGNELKIRLTAPAVEGAANTACIRFVAQQFGLRRSQVRLRTGQRDRHKILVLTGDCASLERRLAELLEGTLDGASVTSE